MRFNVNKILAESLLQEDLADTVESGWKGLQSSLGSALYKLTGKEAHDQEIRKLHDEYGQKLVGEIKKRKNVEEMLEKLKQEKAGQKEPPTPPPPGSSDEGAGAVLGLGMTGAGMAAAASGGKRRPIGYPPPQYY